MTKPCPDCGGPMLHQEDYRSTPWNITPVPSLLWELWKCLDCEKEKSVEVKDDGTIAWNQRGRG